MSDYNELHTLEWDLLNSPCRDCYLNDFECLNYLNKCRQLNED